MPSVLGHEILADVIEVGPGAKGRFSEGDRVVVDPLLSCNVVGRSPCARCAVGQFSTCQHLGDGIGPILGFSNRYPGGFSERMVAHQNQLFKVPNSVSDDRGVLTEPTAVCVHAVVSHPPVGAERVLVIGGGVIAFLTVFVLRELYPDCEVTLLAPESYQRDIARSLGAHHVLGDRPSRELLDSVAKLTNTKELHPVIGRGFVVGGFERVYDCIGSAVSIDDSLRVIGPQGTIVLVGAAGQVSVDLTTLWTKEVKLEGTVYYGKEQHAGTSARSFEIALDLLKNTTLAVESLVTHRFSLEQYQQAIDVNIDRRGSKSVKAVLSP